MPLFAGAASEEQAGILYETMNSISFCALRQGNCFTNPNYDMTRNDFDSRNYWRGPVWININWMLSQGLKDYGYRVSRLFGRNDPRRSLSLDVVDPRIHFALVCGSRSCAPIDYYDSESIARQLEVAAEHFVNSSEVFVLPERNKVFLSQIFRWYRRDFGTREELFRFLTKYMADREKARFLEEHMNSIKIEYLFYDWNLNH